MGKRELVAVLNLSSWYLVMVEWLFLAVSWGCLRFVIVVFPDHTYLLFLNATQPALHLRPSSVFVVRFQESITATWGDGTYNIISFCVHKNFGTQFDGNINELFSLVDNDRAIIMKFNSYKGNAQTS